MNYSITVTVDEYPSCCAECPMFWKDEYRCHSERGYEGYCKLGYMDGHDMRDFSGVRKFRSCRAIVDGKMILKESDGITNEQR